MKRIFEYAISKEYEGIKISRYLSDTGFSSHTLTILRHMENSIILNGKPVYMNASLCEGDKLTVLLTEEKSSENVVPVKLPLNIVYEDEDICVVDKPANMPIHPSQNNHDNSLANALAWYYREKNQEFIYRCINRLDKNTSGLTVIAKNMVAAGILSDQLTNKSESGFTREYLGIVRGTLTEKERTINAPIARVPGSTIERVVDFEKGENAITHIKVIKEKDGYSLVSFLLETGRTHQIRVHMKYIGAPLIGDYIYNPDFERMQRHALHAYRLTFTHPITKKPMSFVAKLPEDMGWID